MSRSSTPAPERDTQILAVGHQCSAPSCLLVDFLPFKCQHCNQQFCADHFKVAAHKCPEYDENKYNRVAPNCPLCNQPVAIRPGQDPNIRMDNHITTECSVVTGKSGKAKSAPVCARGKCGKVLFAPIRCDKCKAQFCPQHRFTADHSCASATRPVSKSASATSKPQFNLNTQVSAASAATMGAIRKTLVTAGTSPSSTISARPSPHDKNPSATVGSTVSNLFSKTDRPLSNANDNHHNSDDNDESTKSTPKPIIDPMAFIPPSLFASA